jgi:hypothetical protein
MDYIQNLGTLADKLLARWAAEKASLFMIFKVGKRRAAQPRVLSTSSPQRP